VSQTPQSAPAALKGAKAITGKVITGIVTSDKMQKTRAVEVTWLERHPKYGKFIRRHTSYKVHDEAEVSREGDTVRITETRPLSKTKRWRLLEVVTKAKHSRIVLPADFSPELEAAGLVPKAAPPAKKEGTES
jgi:small subunit ribosomal protein S17